MKTLFQQCILTEPCENWLHFRNHFLSKTFTWLECKGGICYVSLESTPIILAIRAVTMIIILSWESAMKQCCQNSFFHGLKLISIAGADPLKSALKFMCSSFCTRVFLQFTMYYIAKSWHWLYIQNMSCVNRNCCNTGRGTRENTFDKIFKSINLYPSLEGSTVDVWS